MIRDVKHIPAVNTLLSWHGIAYQGQKTEDWHYCHIKSKMAISQANCMHSEMLETKCREVVTECIICCNKRRKKGILKVLGGSIPKRRENMEVVGSCDYASHVSVNDALKWTIKMLSDSWILANFVSSLNGKVIFGMRKHFSDQLQKDGSLLTRSNVPLMIIHYHKILSDLFDDDVGFDTLKSLGSCMMA